MTVQSVSGEAAPSACYLDTSAVFALAFRRARAEGQPAPDNEVSRAEALVGFLARVRAQGGRGRTSLLALEEIAAKVRNQTRSIGVERILGKAASFRDLKTSDRAKAEAVDAAAHAAMMSMLKFTADALGAESVLLTRPVIPQGTEEDSAKKARKYHRDLLRRYPSIDPMDALHIVIGVECGLKAFVSFDDAWKCVTEIDLFGS